MKSTKFIVILAVLVLSLFQVSGHNYVQKDDITTYSDEVFQPIDLPTVVNDPDTAIYLENSRNLAKNNGTSIDSIYQMVGTLAIVDPTLSSVTTNLKNYWISQLLSFQNSNGGFSTWNKGRSTVAATNNAIQVLSWLNALNQVNQTAVTVYLEKTRNSLTNGYTSSIIDTDSDVYTTYLAVDTYALLGLSPPTVSSVLQIFTNAQNLDSNYVPSGEIGGFGKQTNNQKNIYWTSEATVSRYAVSSLSDFGQLSLIDMSGAVSFLQNLQTTGGGFTNDKLTTTVTIGYTSAAIEALSLLGDGPSDIPIAQNYILGLQSADGGFKKSSTSTFSSLFATYQAVKALNALGYTIPSPQPIIDYILGTSRYTDGYGAGPGAESSLRETFDAVSALVDLNIPIDNPQGIIDYVLSYQNPDGGFGLTNSFTESTFRAISIFNLLGYNYADVTLTTQFVQGLQLPSGGFIKGAGKTVPYVISSYRAIQTLTLLGATPTSASSAIAYLKSTQNTDGGFGGFVGDTSDVSSTYRGVRSLITLGAADFDQSGAISFLHSSQNPDGGFKRSPLDIIGPSNYSNAVFTYSSMRALDLLGSRPQNMSGSFFYIANLHNVDGGYGYADRYTSDIAYLFSAVWLLVHFNDLSDFHLSINPVVQEGQLLSVDVVGGTDTFLLSYSVQNTQISSVLNFKQPQAVSLDTSTLAVGNYTLDVNVTDATGIQIVSSTTLSVVAVPVTTSSSTTSSSQPVSSSQTPAPVTSNKTKAGDSLLLFSVTILAVAAVAAYNRMRLRIKR